MTPEESLEVFGGFDPAEYGDKVKQRWGDTDAYRESARRTKAYTKQDWQRLGVKSDAINQAFIAAYAATVMPTQRIITEKLAIRRRVTPAPSLLPSGPPTVASGRRD